jgi:hypothetical protein
MSITCMSVSPFRVEERFTASLLVFVRSTDVLKVPNCLFSQVTHSSKTQTYLTRHAIRGLFTVPKSRTEAGKCTVLYRAMATLQVTQESNKIHFEKKNG